ncbi:MAG: PadR family transcriptional regulator [Micromonosporaceae bacterium]|nr:PadR family transcriptional regulator [Micromonosporaceae bacterium]
MAKRRRVGNLLALAVLALAAERPMHPYEMATTLRERGKDRSIKINWGSLYTVVSNLEKHGLIEATETVREGRRPERTVYTITGTGLAELRDWLRELLGTPEKEYLRLAAGLSLLPGLPPDEAADLLEQRVGALDAEITHRQAELDTAMPALPRLFLVEEEYELAVLRAEADWTRTLLAELRDGTFPGLSLWRAIHESGLPPAEAAAQAMKQWREGGEPDQR